MSDGFKDVLTAGFQDAGVYGHVLLQAGAYLVGGLTGRAYAYGFAAYDKFQEGLIATGVYAHRQNDQLAAEVADNQAGLNVGKHMWSYLTGHRDANTLKQDLTQALCKPNGGLRYLGAFLVDKKIKVAAGLCVLVLAGAIAYGYFNREIIVYENGNIDGHGFSAVVTCRPDEMWTYYPYLKIQTPGGIEIARYQINGLGYEASKACRSSFPVKGLELTESKNGIRVHFGGRNAFGDRETLEIPVHYFSPR